VLGLPDGETQTVSGHPHLHLPHLRPGHRPGPQRRDQPPTPRRPEWPGDAKRTWSRP
jgi:hypothetical protein